MTIALNIVVIVGAYLWAGIPSAYLIARFRKGIDIRSYGSGNMGATNLMAHVGNWTGFSLGAYDCVIKGTVPVLVAKALGLSLEIQGVAGLAAIAGHNWSPYMGLSGGRGVATGIGVIFGIFMWKEMLILAFVMGFIGRLVFKETGFWTLVSLVTLPLLAVLFNQPAEVVYTTLGIVFLLVAKRLLANGETHVTGYSLSRMLVNRILWDRDVRRKDEWLERMPGPERQGAPENAGDTILQ